MEQKILGAEALIRSLIAEGVDTTFGYPGGAIIPVFDVLYDHKKEIRNILVRHEQGAIHAAQGFARVTGKPGVVIVTSGPGATNVITGLGDANMDSTPLVVITGQVGSAALGSDAFQETDVIGITQPLTKWSYQIRSAEDIEWAVARAFYIAKSGRPGPVVLDFAKNAQNEKIEWKDYKKCNYIRSYEPFPIINKKELCEAAELINDSKRPFILAGNGVTISCAEKELIEFAEKADIPMCNTLLGLSSVPSDHRLNVGMIGMHGNVACNIATMNCDLIIAIGMRFSDRVTGHPAKFAPQAKIIHIDIDRSEFNKNILVDASIHGDAKEVLQQLTPLIAPASHEEWLSSFDDDWKIETETVISQELNPQDGQIKMGQVVRKVSEASGNKAILVTDVGQNQMQAARYFKFTQPRSIITSGGLGTMGFGLPAAIGAQIAAPDRTVCFFTGDGGLQMTVEELGMILQYNLPVKIILLNNNFLGMVRQWQELFYHERYSETEMVNPDFVTLFKAYGIHAEDVEDINTLDDAIDRMLKHNGAYLLNVNIAPEELVYPMIPAGSVLDNILLSRTEKYTKKPNTDYDNL